MFRYLFRWVILYSWVSCQEWNYLSYGSPIFNFSKRMNQIIFSPITHDSSYFTPISLELVVYEILCCLFCCFGSIPSSSQGLILALWSRVTLSRLRSPYRMLGIKARSFVQRQVSYLLLLLFWLYLWNFWYSHYPWWEVFHFYLGLANN